MRDWGGDPDGGAVMVGGEGGRLCGDWIWFEWVQMRGRGRDGMEGAGTVRRR